MRSLACLIVVFGCTPFAAGEVDEMWGLSNGWLTQGKGESMLLVPGEGPALGLTINDEMWPEADLIPVVEEKEGGFDITYADGTGRAIDQVRRFPTLGGDAWLRTVVYENTSSETQDLTRVALRLQGNGLENVWHPRDFWMGSRGEAALCVAYRGTTDHYHLRASGEMVEHLVDACWRLAPGQKAVIGDQGLWIGAAGTEAYRAEARRWFEAIDLRAPELPGWLAEAILYQTCAGGHVDARFSDVGGFDRLGEQVEYLGALGVTAVWLQSVHTHKLPPDASGAWNLYDPRNFEEVDPILGGAEALKRLTDRFQARGIKVIGELVPHGGHSIQGEALPEGWTYNREGEPAGNWGGLSMDYSAPGWQAEMADAAKRLAEDFGMLGARIDVADGSGPNWKSPRTNHASYSTLAGAVELLQAIQQGFVEGGTEGLLLPESWNTMEFFRETPLGYGHALWFLFWQDIPRMIEEPVRMVDTLRDFFELQRGAYPPGTRIIRTLGNHDTTVYSGRVQYRFGAGLANALYGVCLMVPGVPMMYQEEEVGLYETRKSMNRARRAVPEFAYGEVDYFAVDYHPEVFALIRSTAAGRAIGLANLSGGTIRGDVVVTSSHPIAEGTRVYDAVSGAESTVLDGNLFKWTLPPYGVSLIRVGAVPSALALPEEEVAGDGMASLAITNREDGFILQAGTMAVDLTTGTGGWERRGNDKENHVLVSPEGRLEARRQGDGWRVTLSLEAGEVAGLPTLFVREAQQWQVSGRTALLSDAVLRRHYRFPETVNYRWDRSMAWGHMPHQYYNGVCPSGRLWESMLEPLHPERPAIAFADGTGNHLLIEDIETNARNVVLTDRSDEAEILPYGLALRFHDIDPDLRTRYALHGWSFWEREGADAPEARKIHLAFTLRLVDDDTGRAALAAKRRPVHRNQPARAIDSPDYNDEGDTLWLIAPGSVTWSGLDGGPGSYRIAVALRHSERSAEDTELVEAYTIEVNGKAVPFTMEQLNTYETGNAHFGRAITEPVPLKATDNTLTLRTSKTWCAVQPKWALLP